MAKDPLEGAMRTRYGQVASDLDRLRQAEITTGEQKNLSLLEAVHERGLDAVLRRRTSVSSRDDVRSLVEEFVRYGAKAILKTGSQRGGDFLNNQLRGRWAEQVVLSMTVDGWQLLPFGPSGAAMPGEEDHRETIMTFREIHLVEGKRPDVLAFQADTWGEQGKEEIALASSWPNRVLTKRDIELLRQAVCGIEVKNSTWHYGKRREAGGEALSITVKDEELTQLSQWCERIGCPLLFVQVLFDEIYCMSFARMRAAITRGYVYEKGDYLKDADTGAGSKVFHRFKIPDSTHLCGFVKFPDESLAKVRVLEGGKVVPYVDFRPARAHGIRSEVLCREVEFSRES